MADLDYIIADFIDQVEGAGFTDALGHKLEMSQAYIALKGIIAPRAEVGIHYADSESPAKE